MLSRGIVGTQFFTFLSVLLLSSAVLAAESVPNTNEVPAVIRIENLRIQMRFKLNEQGFYQPDGPKMVTYRLVIESAADKKQVYARDNKHELFPPQDLLQLQFNGPNAANLKVYSMNRMPATDRSENKPFASQAIQLDSKFSWDMFRAEKPVEGSINYIGDMNIFADHLRLILIYDNLFVNEYLKTQGKTSELVDGGFQMDVPPTKIRIAKDLIEVIVTSGASASRPLKIKTISQKL